MLQPCGHQPRYPGASRGWLNLDDSLTRDSELVVGVDLQCNIEVSSNSWHRGFYSESYKLDWQSGRVSDLGEFG